MRSGCGCSCLFDQVPWGLCLGLKSQNQAVVAWFWGAPFKVTAEKVLGVFLQGGVGEVLGLVGAPIQTFVIRWANIQLHKEVGGSVWLQGPLYHSNLRGWGF